MPRTHTVHLLAGSAFPGYLYHWFRGTKIEEMAEREREQAKESIITANRVAEIRHTAATYCTLTGWDIKDTTSYPTCPN